MAAEILLLGELSSGKSAFINMLLGVPLMPEEPGSAALPVIRFQSSTSQGVWLRLTDPEFPIVPVNRWTEIPEDWASFQHAEVSIEGHHFFKTGIVLWDTPFTNTPLPYHQEYLHTFLSEKQSIFSSVLVFVSGVPSQSVIDFLKQWPALLQRTTIVVNLTERKSENECLTIESTVKEVCLRELNNIRVKLVYTGDVYEEFHIGADALRREYSDMELVRCWKEIRSHADGEARKYHLKKTGYHLSEIIERTVIWEDIDYPGVNDTVLHQYAENNIDPAQYELGKRLRQQEDHYGAVRYFRMLANKNHGDAMHALSQCYFEGKGVPQNFEAAVSWTRAAADAGVADAQFMMSKILSEGKYIRENVPQAAEYLKMAAASDHVHACARLGELYLTGIDIPVNYELGVKYLTKAVDAGDADAMLTLAACYKKGLGVNRDLGEMIKLLEKAAALDQLDALVALGDAYLAGTGVPIDAAKAFKFYLRAAEAGAVDAQTRVGSCYAKGGGVLPDVELARKYYTMAAESGDETAQFTLGAAYHNGDWTGKDSEKAKYWLRLAGASGHTAAQDILKEIENRARADAETQNSGKCFVVTAAFGDVNADEVVFFQKFRDRVLLHHSVGRKCISAYQKAGPTLARIISGNTILTAISRQFILRIQVCIVFFYGDLFGS